MKVFEGLPSLYRTSFFVFLGYTTIIGYLGHRKSSELKAEENRKFIEYYRHSGHYKHPWVENPSDVPEHVRKTDYTQVIANPQGLRYAQFGHRV